MAAHVLHQLALIIASLIPAILVFAALLVSGRAPFRAAAKVTALIVELSVLAVSLRGISFLAERFGGQANPELVGSVVSLVRLDIVGSPMLVLVCTLAVVVVRYSQRYLTVEPGLARYSRSLLLTLAAVTILVISNHLALLVGAWLGTGI